MSNIRSSLLQEAKRLLPDLAEEELVEVLVGNLDLREATKREKTVVILTKQTLLVYVKDALYLQEEQSNIERFAVCHGVGYCYVE